MTLPASGTISLSNFNTERGVASTTNTDLNWIKSNTKSGQESNSFTGYYNKAWYQRNVDGNCNNGNCNCSGNCGNIQCRNCFSSQCINCANCDSRAWFQNNCNCACTYNCNAGAVSYNCNCACDCACGGGGY